MMMLSGLPTYEASTSGSSVWSAPSASKMSIRESMQGEHDGAVGLARDVQLSPTEIDALTRVGEQNLRDLRHKGGVVDVVVAVVIGHAILLL